MITIPTLFYTITIRDGAVWSTFPDGSTSANWLPDDDGAFAAIARSCGFADPFRYLLAHEVCHALVPEMMFGRPSYVVRMAAQNRKADIGAAMMEEREIYRVQRAACGMRSMEPEWGPIIERLQELGLIGDWRVPTL